MTLQLRAQPLTAAAFAPFGEVIEAEQQHQFYINDGKALRYHDIARAEALGDSARVAISLVDVEPYALPLAVTLLEKHPRGSQAFIPLDGQPFLILAAPRGPAPGPEAVQAFISNGRQGVNYHTDTWHHPIVSLEGKQRFIIIDRIGQGDNCDLHHLQPGQLEVVLA
ncbi:ureidoglycolate lyase [Zobellella sp. DQSA1]|uniref:ureidoglycolate lyase n=1 Tax=Zobellella sp. DQSA1 TaxID=3342386 RepID=UPI0035BFD004